ncbi:hypothetical protein [Teredinibacter sp. KSP-S5-2]|uniref:hypothetical protein n=1 Tax=Teredinibacter sp. KSP-S5-2 TaxID=3034506 RepID=UPI0029344D32|nr:hypothetical protein [Teredinibacter sp. KSP-S5-2]WNO10542.1 hypothetical protein P5V12_05085 [Teredinibacter sp. KSP-S5-2]
MKRIVTLVTFVIDADEENKNTNNNGNNQSFRTRKPNPKTIPPLCVLPIENDREAEQLVKLKLARWVTEADAALTLANSTSSYSSLGIVKGEKIGPAAGLIDAIVDAITDLDPAEFGKDKKPNVKALEKILEQNITAADRDHAWAIYQQLVEEGLGDDGAEKDDTDLFAAGTEKS